MTVIKFRPRQQKEVAPARVIELRRMRDTRPDGDGQMKFWLVEPDTLHLGFFRVLWEGRTHAAAAKAAKPLIAEGATVADLVKGLRGLGLTSIPEGLDPIYAANVLAEHVEAGGEKLTPWQQQFVVSIHEQLVEFGEDVLTERQSHTLFSTYRDFINGTVKAQDNPAPPSDAA
jgi:hypothetical protein